jgi:hypothetical protein
MKCPSFENLIDFADAPATDDRHAAIAAHLASGCDRCGAKRAWYETVKAIAAADDTQDAPPWVLKRAVKLFETRGAQGSAIERLGRVVASLVFDSLARPLLAGTRAVEASGRQLLYKANDYSIDLQMAGIDERRAALSGQILREGEFKFESVGGLECRLVCEGRKILSTMTNPFGEFSISALERGQYDLQIETDEISITVVGLPVA